LFVCKVCTRNCAHIRGLVEPGNALSRVHGRLTADSRQTEAGRLYNRSEAQGGAPARRRGRGREGFPARHPGGVARTAAAAARPHPARRRLPRHRGRAEGGRERIARMLCKGSDELLKLNTHTIPASGSPIFKARRVCGSNGGHNPLGVSSCFYSIWIDR
jgi:hypothetical protein